MHDFVKPIFHLTTLFARCEAKTRIQQRDWSKLVGEKNSREQVGIVPTFFLFARTNSPSGKGTSRGVKARADMRAPQVARPAYPCHNYISYTTVLLTFVKGRGRISQGSGSCARPLKYLYYLT